MLAELLRDHSKLNKKWVDKKKGTNNPAMQNFQHVAAWLHA